jgi:hypothetical protein
MGSRLRTLHGVDDHILLLPSNPSQMWLVRHCVPAIASILRQYINVADSVDPLCPRLMPVVSISASRRTTTAGTMHRADAAVSVCQCPAGPPISFDLAPHRSMDHFAGLAYRSSRPASALWMTRAGSCRK